MKRDFGIFCVLLILASSCSSVKTLVLKKDITKTLSKSELFKDQFTGFSLYDLAENEYVSGYNETKRFTPASNVKILTMYATLKSFDFAIPGVLYEETTDSVWVQPVGDPTFLDQRFESQPVFHFLKSSEKPVNISWPKTPVEPFGAGWAWDDYRYDFQPQRNWWPIYNNMISVSQNAGDISVIPSFFDDFVEIQQNQSERAYLDRDSKYNLFRLNAKDTSQFEKYIPFEWSKDLLLQLLADTLQKPIFYSDRILTRPDTIFSQDLDHVVSWMMKASDNHLAEQLLIMAAWKNGKSSIASLINSSKETWLKDLNDFVWVDGSGLSRYNLIAPIDQVRLLKKSVDEFGLERIKNIMPAGGVSGTIKNWYSADEPYVFAKTGTLSNNHSLSGLLKTKSGKWLIFSFMNNHYTVSTSNVKVEMQKLLEQIRDNY